MFDLSFLNNTDYSDLLVFVKAVLSGAVYLSALVTVASIVMSGLKFMLSMGDEDKIKEAQKSLVFSILGFSACIFFSCYNRICIKVIL
jgi:hypothetical protein